MNQNDEIRLKYRVAFRNIIGMICRFFFKSTNMYILIELVMRQVFFTVFVKHVHTCSRYSLDFKSNSSCTLRFFLI